MSFRACLFAAQLREEASRPLLEARAARLPRFYRSVPWGDRLELRLTYVAGARALVGELRFDERPATRDTSLLTWGGPLPDGLGTAAAVIDARDSELRGLEGIIAAVAVGDSEVVVVSGAGGVTELYAARSSDASVWATHAAAAGLLAFEDPTVERAAIPELLAFDYVGGDLTMVEAVRTVPTATRISLTRGGATVRSYWPASERWARLAEAEAQRHGEQHLLESLERRVSGLGSVSCGLTAGLDSRVAAVAMRELGVSFDAFTVGEESHPDVEAAREVAGSLDAPHRRHGVGWLEEDAALELCDLAARWGDGVRGMTLAAENWPRAIEAFVSGSGAETGRGFYYPPMAAAHPRPGPGVLRTFLTARLRARFGAARSEVATRLRARVDDWLGEAEALGYSGWRSLDVLYGEQRWRRWYRAQLAPVDTRLVPVFSTPEIQRALASLSLADRVSNGFNRAFLQRHAPAGLAPASLAAPSSRRLALMRARRAAASLTRPARAAIRGRARGAPATWAAADRWGEVPQVRRWLMEDVLASSLLADAMGERWVGRTREGFTRDEAIATDATLASAAPLLLQRALTEARSEGSPAGT